MNAFSATAMAPLQDAAGNTYSGVRTQYLLTVPLRIGGNVADGNNPTSFKIKDCDLFCRNVGAVTSLEFRPAAQISQTLLTLYMGDKTGDLALGNLGGVNGGTLYVNAAFTITCNVYAYGSMIVSTGGNLTFNNAGATTQELGGMLINYNATGNLILASNSTPNFYFVNSVCTTSRTGNSPMFTNMNAQDLSGSTLCMTQLDYFINSATGRAVRKATLSAVTGYPLHADIRFLSDGEATEVIWSGTAPVRVVNTSAVAFSTKEYWTFDTKVVDLEGQAVSGIPIYLETDIDGPLLSEATLADGNIEFTDPTTGVDNNVIVRDHYGNSGVVGDTNTLVRDRVFTLTVNGYPDPLISPSPNYQTQKFSFEWPGLDRTPSGYGTDGGTFRRIMMPIRLIPGGPTRDPIWTECEVTP